MSLRGLSVSTVDAENIIQLYNNLDDYDKRPLVYKSVVRRPPTGRFGRKKKRSGHIGVVAMKRCFLSAGAPSLPPSRSRLVEAICIRLCNEFTGSRTEIGVDGRKTFISRWKQVVSAYNNIRARLFNSQALLNNTGITLFNVNETSVSLWFKNKTRREEILTLIQGRPLPGRLTLAKEALPPLRETPSDLQGHADPMLFQEPEDRTGLATLRRKQPVTSQPGPSPVSIPPPQVIILPGLPGPSAIPQTSSSQFASASSPSSLPAEIPIRESRTTLWRRRKKAAESGIPPTQAEPTKRKAYSCKVCGKPMTSEGHSQFKGKRYCPHEPGVLPLDQWLQQRRAEANAKAKEKQP